MKNFIQTSELSNTFHQDATRKLLRDKRLPVQDFQVKSVLLFVFLRLFMSVGKQRPGALLPPTGLECGFSFTELQFAKTPWSLAVVTCGDPEVKITRCSMRSCSDEVPISLDQFGHVLVPGSVLVRNSVSRFCVTSCRWPAEYLDSLMTQRRSGEAESWFFF